MNTLRTVVRRTLVAVFALFLLFEEWGWEPLAALVARLAKLPVLARLEQRIRELPPHLALATFLTPSILLFPVHLAAVVLVAKGYAWTGFVVIVVAKIAGTAIVARLFTLTQPTLMQLAWFARWYPRWKAWKDRIMEEVRGTSAWQAARKAKDSVAAQWAAFIKG